MSVRGANSLLALAVLHAFSRVWVQRGPVIGAKSGGSHPGAGDQPAAHPHSALTWLRGQLTSDPAEFVRRATAGLKGAVLSDADVAEVVDDWRTAVSWGWL